MMKKFTGAFVHVLFLVDITTPTGKQVNRAHFVSIHVPLFMIQQIDDFFLMQGKRNPLLMSSDQF